MFTLLNSLKSVSHIKKM